MYKIRLFSLVGVLAFAVVTAAFAADPSITLASTTSTQASGFFDYFLPIVRARTGIDVRVVAVGTGQALKLGERGDADVVLVHDKIGEMKFVNAGFGIERREVMYNDFVLIGPSADPAAIRALTDPVAALAAVARSKSVFVSRADDSGTHRAELRLWEQAKTDVRAGSGTWYKELGAGMGATLNTAAALGAYTLSDRATWLTFHNRGELELLVSGDERLFNQYSVILVNPRRYPEIKVDLARQFADFMCSADGQATIAAYQIENTVLFKPNCAASH